MATPPPQPLLSICIPTFSRAHLLELCLATVLPQVEQFAGEVECVVSDNCSTDGTAELLAAYAERYMLNIFRNDTNIGIIANITKCISERARGEWALLIGDDDALCAGAVERLLNVLRQSKDLDLIALNVGYLPREQRPDSAQALGGIHAHTDKTLRRSQRDEMLPFEQLFEGPCADLTASYSSVIRRRLWQEYFPTACTDPPFSSVRTTYPHAWIIAQDLPGRRAGLIAAPTVMVYELPSSEFSWSRFHALNTLVRMTELLQMYQRNGVPYSRMRPYYLYQLSNRAMELGDFLWDRKAEGGVRAAVRFAWLLRRYPFRVLKAFLIALSHPKAPRWLSCLASGVVNCKSLVRRLVGRS